MSSRAAGRTIIVGRHSKVWAALAATPQMHSVGAVAIGHREIAHTPFESTDRVWVLSYSRTPEENSALLTSLRDAGARSVFYVSTATTNVVGVTRCYEYPRVKQQAEDDAVRLCGARIVTIGFVYGGEDELPAGRTATTSVDELASFIADPDRATEKRTLLFRPIDKPFRSAIERVLFRAYGALMSVCMPFPCALRPIDVLLRAAGLRWYGYLYLSNRLWFTTTS